jgi:hypothetical protein
LNPAEISESILAFYEIGAVYIALYLSVLSAYMVVAYTAGAKLKSMQSGFINLVFVTFSGILIFATFTFHKAANNYREGFGTIEQSVFASIAPYGILVVQILAVLGALFFMWDIRSSKE